MMYITSRRSCFFFSSLFPTDRFNSNFNSTREKRYLFFIAGKKASILLTKETQRVKHAGTRLNKVVIFIEETWQKHEIGRNEEKKTHDMHTHSQTTISGVFSKKKNEKKRINLWFYPLHSSILNCIDVGSKIEIAHLLVYDLILTKNNFPDFKMNVPSELVQRCFKHDLRQKLKPEGNILFWKENTHKKCV